MDEGIVMPIAPRLHWAWVMVLGWITFGIFAAVWLIVQANWVQKVRGRSAALPLACLALLFDVLMTIFDKVSKYVGFSGLSASVMSFVILITTLVWLCAYFGSIFVMRSELQKEPIGIPLGGILTFFFGTLYFQYFLSDYSGSIRGGGPLGLSSYEPITINRVDETIG